MTTETTAGTAPLGQILQAPQELKERCVRPGNASLAALEAISKAEAALEELSVNFTDWMESEVDRLGVARDTIKASGPSAESVELLFHAAHDLKGQASTLGYPIAAQVCASLCRLLEAFTDASMLPLELVDHHVDAVKAMVRETVTGDNHETAQTLADKLGGLTRDVIARDGDETKTESAVHADSAAA